MTTVSTWNCASQAARPYRSDRESLELQCASDAPMLAPPERARSWSALNARLCPTAFRFSC